jgi:hydrogenase assembly chaperone HypC/HupF
MCIAFPGRVVAVDGLGAIVEAAGGTRHASTLLVPDLEVGEHVAVAAGTIVRRLDPVEAEELEALLRPAVEWSARVARQGGSRAAI